MTKFSHIDKQHSAELRAALERASIQPENGGPELEQARAIRTLLIGSPMPMTEKEWDQRISGAIAHLAEQAKPERQLAPPGRGWVGCIYGGPKVGKTTLGMLAPGVVACDIEDGLGWIDGEKWDCDSWPKFQDLIRRFVESKHQTLLVDTADVLEKRLWEHLCHRNKWSGIESPGFGKGYAEALENWVSVMTQIRAHSKKGKNFLFTAHSQVKTILNPDGESFDRNNINLHNKVSDYFFAQMDFVGYAHFDSRVRKNSGGDFVASTSGQRLISMGGDTLSAQVGNRFGIAGKVPMDASFYKLLGRRN